MHKLKEEVQWATTDRQNWFKTLYPFDSTTISGFKTPRQKPLTSIRPTWLSETQYQVEATPSSVAQRETSLPNIMTNFGSKTSLRSTPSSSLHTVRNPKCYYATAPSVMATSAETKSSDKVTNKKDFFHRFWKISMVRPKNVVTNSYNLIFDQRGMVYKDGEASFKVQNQQRQNTKSWLSRLFYLG